MNTVADIKKYVDTKLAIMNSEHCRAGGDFYADGLDSTAIRTGDAITSYDEGFDNGMAEGERDTLMMLHMLIKETTK